MVRLAPVALLGLVLASGCSRPPTTPAPAANMVSSPREEGDLLARRGDHAGAVAKYREALRATPNDVALRFALGSALSQLDRHAETAEQFRWVVEHGAPGQPEVSMARQWLAAPEPVWCGHPSRSTSGHRVARAGRGRAAGSPGGRIHQGQDGLAQRESRHPEGFA